MFHGLNKSFLYCAGRLLARFECHDVFRETSGTGFFAGTPDRIYFVTNRHILDGSLIEGRQRAVLKSLTIFCRDEDDRFQELIVNSELDRIRFHPVPENDVAILALGEATIHANVSNPRVSYWLGLDLFAKEEEFADDRILSVGDFIAFSGYPYIHDRKENRPIMRMGTIASDPRHDFSSSGKFEGARLLFEGFSTEGSSGSPVFALMKGIRPGSGITFDGFRDIRFVGINAGHYADPRLPHSSLSYLYKSSAILEMLT